MSLRIYVKLGDKQYQVLGNNEFPRCLEEELTRQGAKINADGCFGYDFDEEDNRQYTFKVKDLNGIIKALEQYIKETNDDYMKHKSLYQKIHNGYTAMTIADFSNEVFLQPNRRSLTEAIKDVVDFGYIFCSANLLNFIGKGNYNMFFSKDDVEYELKNNVELYMYAY